MGVGAILQLGWRTEIELSQQLSSWSYQDADGGLASQRLNRDETGTTLHASYLVKGRTRLTLDVEQRDLDFDIAVPDKDSSELTVLGGLRIDTGGPLTGSTFLKVSEKRVWKKSSMSAIGRKQTSVNS